MSSTGASVWYSGGAATATSVSPVVPDACPCDLASCSSASCLSPMPLLGGAKFFSSGCEEIPPPARCGATDEWMSAFSSRLISIVWTSSIGLSSGVKFAHPPPVLYRLNPPAIVSRSDTRPSNLSPIVFSCFHSCGSSDAVTQVS